MNLKKIREELNIKQPEVAEMLGMSVPNYSKKENSEVKFSLDEAKKISLYFGKSIDEIFFPQQYREMTQHDEHGT